MMLASSTSWVLSILFGTLAIFYITAAILDAEFGCRHSGGRFGAFLHALMAGGMIPMSWAWGLNIPPIAFVLTFTAAALWFLARGLFTAASPLERPSGWFWYHTAMMGSMVWMAVVMAWMSSMQPSGAGPDMMAMSAGEMAGMSMAGMHPDSATMILPSWSRIGSVITAVVFGLAALVLLLRSVQLIARRARYGAVTAETARVVMAAGMCAAFAVMA